MTTPNDQLAAIYRDFADRQQPLGEDIEAVIFANIASLYDSDED